MHSSVSKMVPVEVNIVLHVVEEQKAMWPPETCLMSRVNPMHFPPLQKGSGLAPMCYSIPASFRLSWASHSRELTAAA